MAGNSVVTPLPPGVVFRRATPRDQEGVVAIGDMFNQLDYLNFMYPFYMLNPEFHCYLLEENGRPVCFMYVYIVDDGETMISGAGRTAADFKGKGYIGMLIPRARAHTIQQLERKPTRFIATAFDTTFHRERARIHPNKFDIFITRHLLSRKTTKGNLSRVVYSKAFQELERNFPTQIWMPTDREMAAVLSDRTTADQLFPDGHFIAIWEPYKATTSNMSLARKASKVFVSGDRSAGLIKALSLVSEVPCTAGLRYDLEFYGSDTADVLRHLYNYMRNVTTLPLLHTTVIEMVLYLPTSIDKVLLEQHIAGYRWDLGSWSDRLTYIAAETLHPVPRL